MPTPATICCRGAAQRDAALCGAGLPRYFTYPDGFQAGVTGDCGVEAKSWRYCQAFRWWTWAPTASTGWSRPFGIASTRFCTWRAGNTAVRCCGWATGSAGARDLTTDCSCPDWANPCKHIAATYYILAEAFDQDPFLLFQWRGRDPKQLQERLAQFRAAEAVDAEPLVAGMDWESLGPGRFWAAGAIPRPVPTLSPRCDLLARQLGPSPVNLMGRDFADLLEELVTTAAKEARALLES